MLTLPNGVWDTFKQIVEERDPSNRYFIPLGAAPNLSRIRKLVNTRDFLNFKGLPSAGTFIHLTLDNPKINIECGFITNYPKIELNISIGYYSATIDVKSELIDWNGSFCPENFYQLEIVNSGLERFGN